MGELYDEDVDVFAWSEHQARLLRQHAAGEPGNEASDWTNIIEGVESVGQSQIDAVESLWFRAFLYDLKAEAWPRAWDALAWRGSACGFRAQARHRYRPSMQHRLNVAGLYAHALEALPERLDDLAPLPVPSACPVTLDELLDLSLAADVLGVSGGLALPNWAPLAWSPDRAEPPELVLPPQQGRA